MRSAILVGAVLLAGCSGMVERPEAAGLVREPHQVDRRAERDTRMGILHAVHPEPIRPSPDFVAVSAEDLLADDIQRVQALIAAGNTSAAHDLVAVLIERVASMDERHDRRMREAAERRNELLTEGLVRE